jgi:hypothetical protein
MRSAIRLAFLALTWLLATSYSASACNEARWRDNCMEVAHAHKDVDTFMASVRGRFKMKGEYIPRWVAKGSPCRIYQGDKVMLLPHKTATRPFSVRVALSEPWDAAFPLRCPYSSHVDMPLIDWRISNGTLLLTPPPPVQKKH